MDNRRRHLDKPAGALRRDRRSPAAIRTANEKEEARIEALNRRLREYAALEVLEAEGIKFTRS